jgi:tRNA threonylcarbamoyl adenosine modification protein (Sua5/YciO/YrdC/YwlC family)
MATIEIQKENPDNRQLKQVADELKQGGIIICPTDTLYAFMCRLSNRSGIEKICKLVGKRPERANLSIICCDLKHISDYTMQFSKSTYKLMNRNLPGPVTFILNANNRVPKLFLSNRKTIGIRVPDHKVPLGLVEMIDEPLVSASVHHPEDLSVMLSEIYEIEEYYRHSVSTILDCGDGGTAGSAIVDCTGDEPVLVREGEMEIR